MQIEVKKEGEQGRERAGIGFKFVLNIYRVRPFFLRLYTMFVFGIHLEIYVIYIHLKIWLKILN